LRYELLARDHRIRFGIRIVVSGGCEVAGDCVRRAAKVDASQSLIVDRLRSIGVWVRPTHTVGQGFPDLLCWHKRFFMIEVKQPGEKPNKQQAEFMAACPGEIHVARTPEEAVTAALGEKVMA
jgi:hypothetical protein